MTTHPTIREQVKAHATACRAALAAGEALPTWSGGSLRGADIGGAVLRGANLRGADLSGAVLIAADLRGANLRGADLSAADLRGVDLREVDLRGANLRGADLRDAYVTEGTVYAHACGISGGYRWHALLLEDGAIILQYGSVLRPAPLNEWRQRGPEYCAQYGQGLDHWAIGPAVAIAAAAALEPA